MTEAEKEVLAALADGPRSIQEIIPLIERRDQSTLATITRAMIELIAAGKVERILVNKRPVYRVVDGI
ncbi:MAG TPA: hypothetical protein ENH55_15255 [Aurantimonas coralicida]|uniref:Uncharacterized protein n=2 Tax=root TaxID=1 RepID=A0A9C9TIR2_9HYPH|nr:hypothetical protein [Aurantimonas coralicida]HEU02627.1 hypothetical protein [Aurantimonas coralicida]